LALLAIAPWTAYADPPTPTISITSPTAGSTVMGDVTITATATAGPGDYPNYISYRDGVNDIGSTNCEGQRTCTTSIKWPATGLSGQHTLTAYVATSEGGSATSAPVTVTVVSPPPTVSITSPTPGSTVEGTVSISVSGATDPSQVDYPTSIDVYDGVNYLNSVDCQGQQTCQGSVSWRTTGMSGPHTLTAKIHTNKGVSEISAPVTVTVVSPPPTVTITNPRSGTPLNGGVIIVSASGATNPSQVDYPTSISIYDGTGEVGNFGCQGQTTCSGSVRWNTSGLKGAQKIYAEIHTNTGRTANSPVVVVGNSPGRRHSSASCHLRSFAVPLRRADRGYCVIHGAPARTPVDLQYRNLSGGWTTVVRGHVMRGGRFTFTLRGAKRATFPLSLLIGSSRLYVTTRVSIGTLQIG
jgi:Bacterial Ig domain